MDDTKLLVFLLCFIAQFCLSISASDQVNSFQSVPDLEKSMYMAIDGYPCVRLLNLSGEIGCSNPGRANIVAPVARFKTANKLAEPSALVVSIDQFEELFGRHVDLSLCSFFGPKIVYLLRSFECKTLSVLIFYLKILSHVIVGQLSLSYRSFPHSPNSRASLSG